MDWELHVAGSDTWNIFWRGDHVGDVIWIGDLRHASLTMARIADGLNGLRDSVPPRCWSTEPATPHRWNLLHNGRPKGEVAWLRPPRDEPAQLLRILAGLNWSSTRLTAAEPAPPHRARIA